MKHLEGLLKVTPPGVLSAEFSKKFRICSFKKSLTGWNLFSGFIRENEAGQFLPR